MDKILISVIVPIYNTSKYLDRCLQSIINQTFKNTEIILIDDGSTDNSLEICKKNVARYKNIKLYSKRNSGQGATRNFGILEAKGKYIGFVDSDDYIDRNMYEYMLGLAECNDSDIVCCKYDRISNSEDIYKKIEINRVDKIENDKEDIIKSFLLNEISASPCDKIFRKDLLIKNNIRFPESTYYEDIYMILNSIYHSNKVVINKTAFYKYFKRNDSTTLISDEKHLNDLYNQIVKCYSFIYENYDYRNLEIELKSAKFLHTNMFLKIIKDLSKEKEVMHYFERLSKKLVIFGASSAGELMKYFCDLFDINVLYFCDNSELKWENKLADITIISPKKLVELMDDKYGIYIASMHYKDIYNQLSEFGLKDKIIDLNFF